jgi:hypothetical protein
MSVFATTTNPDRADEPKASDPTLVVGSGHSSETPAVSSGGPTASIGG